MNIYLLLLFTTIIMWSRMSDGYVHAGICTDAENLLATDQKQCESCSCENIILSTDDSCSSEFCPCSKILCTELSTLKDLRRHPQIRNIINSDMKKKIRWRRDLHNKDQHDRDGKDSNFVTQIDGRHEQKPEQEREQSELNSEHVNMPILYLGYTIPILKSTDSRLIPVLVVLLYSTIVVIGVTICSIIYRKYGYDKNKNRSTVNVEKPSQKLKRSGSENDYRQVSTKCLLEDHPPSYDDVCVV